MQLGDLALGQGDELDAEKGKLLIKDGDVRLVAREAVEGLGQDNIETARPGVCE